MDCASLPDLDSLGVEALKALAIRRRVEIATQRAERAARGCGNRPTAPAALQPDRGIRRSGSEPIEPLKLVIEKLRRIMLGVKSKKIVVQVEQLELQLEELESARAEMETAADAVVAVEEPKARPVRKPLPGHFVREVITHLPAEGGDCCPDCGGALRRVGEDVSEQLGYITESFTVIRHARTPGPRVANLMGFGEYFMARADPA